MKKIFVIISLVLCSTQALAASAYFTGRSKMITTVTYKQAWACEYNYSGRKFWELFEIGTSCPSSVEVE